MRRHRKPLISGFAAALVGSAYACLEGSLTAPPGVDASADDAGVVPDALPSPPCAAPSCVSVVTEHYDNARTGAYGAEAVLKPANVNQAMFGKLFELEVDGKVDAQPLYVQGVAVAGRGTHDVLYVVTEHDSIYAFDADADGAPLWKVSALASGEEPSDDRSCPQVTPEIGITSTPVIDRATGTMYLVAMSKSGGQYHQRIHAVDITSGAERLDGPKEIVATVPGSSTYEGDGTNLRFDPAQHKERSALLFDHGRIYTSWASHCDHAWYTGWILAHDASTLATVAAWNTVPNGKMASFWNAGAGPAADSAGSVYHMSGNGDFETTLTADGFPTGSDYGNSFVKLASHGGSLVLADYFTMGNEVDESEKDVDLGSGGVLLLPDEVGSAAHPHLLVGSGKDAHLYLLDRDAMGKFDPDGGNAGAVQDIPNATGSSDRIDTGEYGAPAYFRGALYFGGIAQPLKRWTIANGAIVTPHASETSLAFAYPGTTPTISWDGADPATAIVWAHENTSPPSLHAYSATDLSVEYWNSAQAPGGRDVPAASGNKFIIPMVANGRVYVGTQSSVVVYGLR